jgi:hypothetical protein
VNHTLVTLLFENIEMVELDGFGAQNVLDELVIDDRGPGFVSASRIVISLPSNNGLSGSFRCEYLIVLAVAPFEPGPHSVHRADR